MIDRNFTKALPVLFGFFVMGFCDVVGIATSYIKNDFSLSETVAGFIRCIASGFVEIGHFKFVDPHNAVFH